MISTLLFQYASPTTTNTTKSTLTRTPRGPSHRVHVHCATPPVPCRQPSTSIATNPHPTLEIHAARPKYCATQTTTPNLRHHATHAKIHANYTCPRHSMPPTLNLNCNRESTPPVQVPTPPNTDQLRRSPASRSTSTPPIRHSTGQPNLMLASTTRGSPFILRSRIRYADTYQSNFGEWMCVVG